MWSHKNLGCGRWGITFTSFGVGFGIEMLWLSGQDHYKFIQFVQFLEKSPPSRCDLRDTQLRNRWCFSWKKRAPFLPVTEISTFTHPLASPSPLLPAQTLEQYTLSLLWGQHQFHAWAAGVFMNLGTWRPVLVFLVAILSGCWKDRGHQHEFHQRAPFLLNLGGLPTPPLLLPLVSLSSTLFPGTIPRNCCQWAPRSKRLLSLVRDQRKRF